MHATTPLNELITALATMGWEFKGVKTKKGEFVASAKNPTTGQDIERTGNSPEMAVHAVFQYAQRANSIRSFARQIPHNLLYYEYGDTNGKGWQEAKEEGQGASLTASKEAAQGSLGQEVISAWDETSPDQLENYWWPEWDDIDDISQRTVVPHQGYRDTGLIEGAVGNARMAYSYGQHGDIFDTAADIIAKVQRQQAVVEGNKRTATALGLHWLQENGYDISRVEQEPYWSELVNAIWQISDAEDALGQAAIDRTAQVLREASLPIQPDQVIAGWTKSSTIVKLAGFYFWSADIHELAEKQRQTLLNRSDVQKMDPVIRNQIQNYLELTPDQGYKLMPWLVREYKKLKSVSETAPDDSTDYQNPANAARTNLTTLPNLVEEATKWVEYARTYNLPLPEINNKDFDGDKLWAWVTQMKEQESVDPRGWKDSHAVYSFPDGWYIAEVGADDLAREGKIMQHCVGGESYINSVEREDLSIYSLREPNGRPHATMSVEGNPNLQQAPPNEYGHVLFPEIYGKQDRAPEPQYQAYIEDWIGHLRQLGWSPEQGEGEPPEPEHEWVEHAEGSLRVDEPEELFEFGRIMRDRNAYDFYRDEEGEYSDQDNTYYYQNARQIEFSNFPVGDPDGFVNLLNLFLNELESGETEGGEPYSQEDAIEYVQNLWMLSNMMDIQNGRLGHGNPDSSWNTIAPVLKQELESRMYHEPQVMQDTSLFNADPYNQQTLKGGPGEIMAAMDQYLDLLSGAPTTYTEDYQHRGVPADAPEWDRVEPNRDWYNRHVQEETLQRDRTLRWPDDSYNVTDFGTYFNQLQPQQPQTVSGWKQPHQVAGRWVLANGSPTFLTNLDDHWEDVPMPSPMTVPERAKEKVAILTNPDMGPEDPFSTPGGIGGGAYGWKIVMVDKDLTLKSPQQSHFIWAVGGAETVAESDPGGGSDMSGINFVADGETPINNNEGKPRMFQNGFNHLESYKEGKPWVLIKCQIGGKVAWADDGARSSKAVINDIYVPDGVKWYGKWDSEEVAKVLRNKYVADVTVKDMDAAKYRVPGWSFEDENIDLGDGWNYVILRASSVYWGMNLAIYQNGEVRASVVGELRGDDYVIAEIDNGTGSWLSDSDSVEAVKATFENLKEEKNYLISWAQDAEQGRDQDNVESEVDWDNQEVYSVEGVDELIRLWGDIQQSPDQFIEFTAGDGYSDSEWSQDDSSGVDEFGLPLWRLIYTEYPPTAINLDPATWRTIMEEAIGIVAADNWQGQHVDEEMLDELVQSLYGVPVFLSSGEIGSSQFDSKNLHAWFEGEIKWGIQYALGLIGESQMAQEETLFDAEDYGKGIGLAAHPQLNRFFNLLQYYVDNSSSQQPMYNSPDTYTVWGDPETPEWGRRDIALPGTLSAKKKDPSYIWIWYKSELRVEDWHHNRKHTDMIDELFDEFGRDFSNEVHAVEADQVAAGIVYEYSNGSFKIEHEQMNDPAIRDYAEVAIEEWLGSWIEVTFKKKRKKKSATLEDGWVHAINA